MKNRPINKRNTRERKGVGAIIGGVILVTILVTSVLIYYLSILNSDKIKASYDIQATQLSSDKSAEKIIAVQDEALVPSGGNNYIHTAVTNDGPFPGVVALSALYCTSCASPNNPTIADTTSDPGN